MARKKEFDPLGGSIGSEKPKKAKKDNMVLGSKEHAGSSSIYDDVYYMPVSEGSTDALTASGASDKPKKKGLFAGVFGHKKSPNGAKPKSKAETKSKSASEPDFRITQDPVITQTENDPYPVMNIREEDIFEDEPRTINEPAVLRAEPAEEPVPPKMHTFVEVEPKKPTVRFHPKVCYLCGADSLAPHQLFGFGGESDPESAVPLCKTCMRAVNTLMKYRDPADEQEIKSEWRVLAPGLDEKRVDDLIREGRRNFLQ